MKLPNLRSIRERKLLSQRALAESAKVSPVTVSNIENGSEAELRTVRKLADALNVEPAELMEA